jgi:two-component system response regulator AtoC
MKILVVDDDEVTRNLLREVLVKEGFSVFLASSGEEAVARLAQEKFSVVLSDIRMAGGDGFSVLRSAKAQGSRGPSVVLMTGFGSMEGAIEAIRDGAFDYISKPFRMDELKALIKRARQHYELASGQEKKAPFREVPDSVIGRSAPVIEIFKTVARAALTRSPVLLLGEAGTGKQKIARSIHDHSPQRSGPWIVDHCSSQTESSVWDSALGGSLLLDDVELLPLHRQIDLLSWMQKNAENVRVMAASTVSLESRVTAHEFREDLFYALKIISIELPPLRNRIEDLNDLVDFFLVRASSRAHKVVSHVSDEAFLLLKNYRWPGNIRELENAIESAVVLTRSQVLFPEDFPPAIRSVHGDSNTGNSLEQLEKEQILKVLNEADYNKSRAAEILGIDRATLYRKAQKFQIDLQVKSDPKVKR